MNGSLSHFKAILQRKKERKNKASTRFDKKRLKYDGSTVETEFDFPSLSKPEMDKLKQEIRTKLKKDKLRDYILFCLTLIILFILGYYFVN